MFLTIKDAARQANVSESTIREWIDDGELMIIQPRGPGHLVRIHKGDLYDYLALYRVLRGVDSVPSSTA